ncbi:hypothetical protein D3C72_2438820 [compost metagenome]
MIGICQNDDPPPLGGQRNLGDNAAVHGRAACFNCVGINRALDGGRVIFTLNHY